MFPLKIQTSKIQDPVLKKQGIELSVLRLDEVHPVVSGNKFFKLKYNLQRAQDEGKSSILTYGGAFSNHIVATAFAAKEAGMESIGIIRGEESSANNPTLSEAREQGMKLLFVSRELYRNKLALQEFADRQFDPRSTYTVPEGGANAEGIRGAAEIMDLLDGTYDLICAACGTGTTLAGIISACDEPTKVMGFQVLKGENYIAGELQNTLKEIGCQHTGWEVNEDYHFGGYAKRTPELIRFVEEFERQHKIPLDFIYTGKMMFGLMEMIHRGKFPKGQRILAVHSGGLQGNRGFEPKTWI